MGRWLWFALGVEYRDGSGGRHWVGLPKTNSFWLLSDLFLDARNGWKDIATKGDFWILAFKKRTWKTFVDMQPSNSTTANNTFSAPSFHLPSSWSSSEKMGAQKLSIKLRACHSEWSKSEREKQIPHINRYIWNLKWYWWTYFQGRSRDPDVENRVRESSTIDRVALIYLHFHVPNIELVGSACKAQWAQVGALCWDTKVRVGGRGGSGREVQEGGDICIHIADSRCCRETNTTL